MAARMTPIDQCPKCQHPWDLHEAGGYGMCIYDSWIAVCGCTEKRPAQPSGEQGEMFVNEGEYPE